MARGKRARRAATPPRTLARSPIVSVDQVRPEPATQNVVPIENLDVKLSGKRTAKLPHFGMASCLIKRMPDNRPKGAGFLGRRLRASAGASIEAG